MTHFGGLSLAEWEARVLAEARGPGDAAPLEQFHAVVRELQLSRSLPAPHAMHTRAFLCTFVPALEGALSAHCTRIVYI
jgi:hypothetical protein